MNQATHERLVGWAGVLLVACASLVTTTPIGAQQTRIYEVDWAVAAQEANRKGYCFSVDGWGPTYAWANAGGAPSVTAQSLTLTLSGDFIPNGAGGQITNGVQLVNRGAHTYRMFGPKLSCEGSRTPIAPNQILCRSGGTRHDPSWVGGLGGFREEVRRLRRGWSVESVDVVTPPGFNVVRMPARGTRNLSVVLEVDNSGPPRAGTITGKIRLRGSAGRSWRRAFVNRPSCSS